MTAKVVLVDSFLKAYRVPLFEGMIQYLRPQGVELNVVFGQPDRFHSRDTDIVHTLPWATHVRNAYLNCGRTSLVWQPVLKHLRGSDLVIVHQGNRHILNHLLLLLGTSRGFGLAFFGHGRNFQSVNPTGLAERIKRAYSCHVDWWFAYTERSKAVLQESGFPGGRTTVVQNAIDVTRLVQDYESILPTEVEATRAELGIGPADIVGIYCGRFYYLKDMDFTLSCAEEIHRREPRFRFVLVGDGAETVKVREFCQDRRSWAHYVGPRYGRDKCRYFRIASCQLMPGAVGLSIVDSFAMLTPLITRELDKHGPEIDYLQNGGNGVITASGATAYVDGVVDYIRDEALQQELVRGCLQSRSQYTIENMVQRFGDGICKALSQLGRSPGPMECREKATG